MFERNEGTVDRIARLVLASVLLPAGVLWLGALQGNVGGLFAAGVGVIALITGATGVCPTYNLFGISTVEAVKKQSLPSRAE